MDVSVYVESAARGILSRAGYHADDTPGAVAVARRLGVDLRQLPPGRFYGSLSRLILTRTVCRIDVREGISAERTQWDVAHEVAELWLAWVGYRGRDIEQLANRIAAALLMPRRVFRETARETHHDLGMLSRLFLTSQTAVALRLAEVDMARRVVVACPSRTYLRRGRGKASYISGQLGDDEKRIFQIA